MVFGQKALANLCHFIGVVRFSEQCERFSQNGVVLFGDDKWCSHVGLERLFHLLDLDFDAPAAHHIVDAAEYAKAIVTEFSAVVGHELLFAHHRSVNHQASAVVEAHPHAGKRRVPPACLIAIEATEGNVREGFGHAIGAPHRTRKIFQFLFQIGENGASANNKMLNGAEFFALVSHF